MYNRYIPQSDGTFRRSRVAEPSTELEQNAVPEPTQIADEPETPQPVHIQNQAPPRNVHPRRPQPQKMPVQEQNSGSVSGFLKGLLPQNFDTEDLIVVLLLLLISGNNANDQNAALLTLGIYLFM